MEDLQLAGLARGLGFNFMRSAQPSRASVGKRDGNYQLIEIIVGTTIRIERNL